MASFSAASLGLAVLASLVVVSGCGESKPSDPSLAEVKACLTEAGLEPQGGETNPNPDDEDAPDVGALMMPEIGTFIAFYSSEARADQFADSLRENAEETGGTTTRHGKITVLYAKGPGATGEPDDKIEDCV